ncbi:hypothetical protein JT739_07320 [Tepidanaerobacter sp. GT38]|uniref:stalk domain-containing protein n=1 Tax=Tepidanaerobacter sp. GT38 TaxID=2722793 RepID=UPI001F3D6953|nr:stalk domain-containing protein [Tepidanaerobacter sp. GT38]MCG1012407.1 hypothetical protein [Tepidanaerobacter sp. GT38]
MYKKTIITAIVITFIFAVFTPTAAYASENPISVIADGKQLTFDVPPILHNNRTLVPFRAIFEAYGATDIKWNQNLQKATGTVDGITIELTVGSNTAIVNGKSMELDVPPIVKNGRVLVPIRFISEALGYDVEWDNAKRQVIVKSQVYCNTFYNNTLGVKLRMGQEADELIAIMGEPDRIDKSGKYYDWYIYNNDLEHYIQVGVYDNKIVAFATNASSWVLNNDLRIGDLKRDIEKKYELRGNVIYLREDNLEILWDIHNNNSLSTFILERRNTDSNDLILSEDYYTEEVARSFERQAFDLTNVYRLRNGRKSLAWREDLAKMALYHSNDMATNGYFSHDSLNGDTLGDRAAKFLGNYRVVGENIAMGFGNALRAVGALYNSESHRENMLMREYEYLGVGVAFRMSEGWLTETLYLTQNFCY